MFDKMSFLVIVDLNLEQQRTIRVLEIQNFPNGLFGSC